ncbi:MAG: TolC family protein [Sphingobacteriales bacterium]|nr:MAG: TolC family protein [Sphingobacteriales bacterium]
MTGKFLILFCLIASVAGAQERLTLEEAVRRALEHNYDVRVAAVTVEQATVNNTLGNAGLLPDINGNAGFNTGSSNTRIEFADGRVQEVKGAQTMSYNGGVTASYTLFAAGRAWLIRKQLGANEQFAQLQLREQMQLTVAQTIQTYARTVWQQQQAIAIDTGLALAQVRMTLSQMKFETGLSAKVDFLQARVDYNARQSDSMAQIAAVNAAFADLNFLMGADPYKDYIVDDSLSINTTLTPADPARLQDQNLSIELARKNIDISRLTERITRTAMFPTLGVTTGYNYNRSKSQAGFALFNQSSGPTAGLALNVPIFQGGNLRRQTRIASLETMRSEILLERQSTEVTRQYRTAWKNYEMAVATYRLERTSLGYAKENVDIQKARFRVGIATTLETREAENSYVQALIRFYTAAYNLKVNETNVLQLESTLVK